MGSTPDDTPAAAQNPHVHHANVPQMLGHPQAALQLEHAAPIDCVLGQLYRNQTVGLLHVVVLYLHVSSTTLDLSGIFSG